MFRKVDGKKYKDNDPEIIAWQREDKGELETCLLSSFPQPGDNIKNKKYFAVKDYEKVLFYNKGELIDVLGGGIYELDKKARIKGTEIVWIDTSFLTIPWGVPMKDGIPTKDGFVVGLHGDLKLRINNAKIFYNDIVAGKKEWIAQDLKDWIMTLLHTSLRDIFKNYIMKSIILEERERIINFVTSKITDEFGRYGLELETFNVIGLKTPSDVEDVLEHKKHKTKTIAQSSKSSLDNLIKQKQHFENRIKDLTNKMKELQNKLLNDEIDKREYDKKNQQIQSFIDEAQEELKKIDEAISKS